MCGREGREKKVSGNKTPGGNRKHKGKEVRGRGTFPLPSRSALARLPLAHTFDGCMYVTELVACNRGVFYG